MSLLPRFYDATDGRVVAHVIRAVAEMTGRPRLVATVQTRGLDYAEKVDATHPLAFSKQLLKIAGRHTIWFVYTNNEYDGAVYVYSFDPRDGAMSELQIASVRPEGQTEDVNVRAGDLQQVPHDGHLRYGHLHRLQLPRHLRDPHRHAEGRHDVEVSGTDRGDELGHMAKAVLVFRDAAVEKERLEAESADAQKAAEVERQRNEAKVFPGCRFFAVSNNESDQNKPKVNRKRRTERHARSDRPRFAGWWGNDPATRFNVAFDFVPRPGAVSTSSSSPRWQRRTTPTRC